MRSVVGVVGLVHTWWMVRGRFLVVVWVVAVFGLVGSTFGRVGADSNEGRAGSVRGGVPWVSRTVGS